MKNEYAVNNNTGIYSPLFSFGVDWFTNISVLDRSFLTLTTFVNYCTVCQILYHICSFLVLMFCLILRCATECLIYDLRAKLQSGTTWKCILLMSVILVFLYDISHLSYMWWLDDWQMTFPHFHLQWLDNDDDKYHPHKIAIWLYSVRCIVYLCCHYYSVEGRKVMFLPVSVCLFFLH